MYLKTFMEHLVCATPSAKYQEYKSKTQLLPEKQSVAE